MTRRPNAAKRRGCGGVRLPPRRAAAPCLTHTWLHALGDVPDAQRGAGLALGWPRKHPRVTLRMFRRLGGRYRRAVHIAAAALGCRWPFLSPPGNGQGSHDAGRRPGVTDAVRESAGGARLRRARAARFPLVSAVRGRTGSQRRSPPRQPAKRCCSWVSSIQQCVRQRENVPKVHPSTFAIHGTGRRAAAVNPPPAGGAPPPTRGAVPPTPWCRPGWWRCRRGRAAPAGSGGRRRGRVGGWRRNGATRAG